MIKAIHPYQFYYELKKKKQPKPPKISTYKDLAHAIYRIQGNIRFFTAAILCLAPFLSYSQYCT